MNTIEKIDRRRNIIVLLLAFVLGAAFIDKHQPDIYISDYYIYEVLLFLTCIMAGAYVLCAKKIVLIKHWITIPFVLIILWSLAEMRLFPEGLKYAPKFFIFALAEMFIFINIVINFVDKENYGDFIKYICWVFMALSFLLAGYYFSQGVFINFNSFGQSYTKYLLGFGAFGCYYLMLSKRKTVYGILTYLLLVLCVLSLVRKMWLALLITFVVITVIYLAGPPRKALTKKEYRKTIYMILALLLAIVVAAASLMIFVPRMVEAAIESLGSINLAETSLSDMSRRLMNAAAIEKFLQSPIIGNGWGDKIYIEKLDVKSLYHNCYLSVLCQLGLIGFILYYGVFAYPLVKAIQMMRKREHFYYGLFLLGLWLFSAVNLFYRPLNRMSYYLWGPPLIVTLAFESWAANKTISLGWKKRQA